MAEEEQATEQASEPQEDSTPSLGDVRDPGVDNAATEPQEPSIPEGIPEKFVKDGVVDYEALAKSYTHLESKLGKGHEPAPEDYALNLPDGYQVPEGDVLYNEFKSQAKELGLSQQQHDAILNMFIEQSPKVQEQQMKAWQEHLEQEFKMLGPDSNKRLKALEGWARNNLPEGHAERIQTWLTSKTDVEALEAIMRQTRDQRLPRQIDAMSKSMDAGELRDMRYAKDDKGRLKMQVDPEYRKMVDRAYEEFYGNEPVSEIVTAVR